jgi:hypothetical protein
MESLIYVDSRLRIFYPGMKKVTHGRKLDVRKDLRGIFIKPEYILNWIEGTKYGDVLVLPEQELIPRYWIREARKKVKDKKRKRFNQQDIQNHARPLKIDSLSPEDLKLAFEVIEKSWRYYPRIETKKRECLKVEDLFEAFLIMNDFLEIPERFEVKYLGNEVICETPARRPEELRLLKKYGVEKIKREDIPSHEVLITNARENPSALCDCEYSCFSRSCYLEVLCPHKIIAFKEIEKKGYPRVLPDVTGYGIEFYSRIRDNIFKERKGKTRRLTNVEKSILIQTAIKKYGLKNFLKF